MHFIKFWSIFAISISLFAIHVTAKNLELKFQWKTIDFDFENKDRQEYINSKKFIPENVIPIGLDIYKDRLFLTLPRLKHGVPATLAYINLTDPKQNPTLSNVPANLPANDVAKAPLLKPYPNWAAHETTPTGGVPDIVSPFHIKIDRCDRLWAIDTGTDGSIDLLKEGKPNQLTNSRILIYNLANDNLIRTYQVPAAMNHTTSIYSNIVVDDTDCENAYAFVANAGVNKPHLLVYSFKNDNSWTVEHNFFHMDPLAGNFSVLGVDYQTSDALYGLTLTEKKSNNFPDLYFHALTSYHEFKVSTQTLREKTSGLGQKEYYKEFSEVGKRGTNEQSGTSAYDNAEKTIFYTLPNKNEVACWRVANKKEDYLVENVFSSPGYPFDVKIDEKHQIWILSNNIHRFIKGDMTTTYSANFFIHFGSVSELIKHTKCEAGYIEKIKQKIFGSDSITVQPITSLLFITSILLSLKHLF